MGRGIEGQPTTIDGITRADGESKCDVCGRATDVAQIICVMESPTGEPDGLANVVYICTFCLARAIQEVTGFRMVRQLKNWYHLRRQYPTMDPKYYRKVNMEDTAIE